MNDWRKTAAFRWRVLAATLAVMIGAPSHAALLTYEYDPGPVTHWGFHDFGDSSEEITCDNIGTYAKYPFTCGETLDGADTEFGGPPLLTFDTAVMPFELSGKRLLVLTFDDYWAHPQEGIFVLDEAGSIIYQLSTDYFRDDLANTPWLLDVAWSQPWTYYDLTFDGHGLVKEWYVHIEFDPWGQTYSSDYSLSLGRSLDDCYGIFDDHCIVAYYEGHGLGEWLINGVPQSELAPAPVPLPGALGLLAAAAGLLSLLRAGRAART